MAKLLNQNVGLPSHDREHLGEQNATASHTVSSARRFLVSMQQSYTRLRWRVHFVPSCNASMLHVYQTYRVYKLCIYIIHCYVLVYFVSYCRFQVSVLSYVLVKPENPSEYRLNEENLG